MLVSVFGEDVMFVWGHVQALLLVLVGGVTKEMDDGMRLRGDIHACLMGAPAECETASAP